MEGGLAVVERGGEGGDRGVERDVAGRSARRRRPGVCGRWLGAAPERAVGTEETAAVGGEEDGSGGGGCRGGEIGGMEGGRALRVGACTSRLNRAPRCRVEEGTKATVDGERRTGGGGNGGPTRVHGSARPRQRRRATRARSRLSAGRGDGVGGARGRAVRGSARRRPRKEETTVRTTAASRHDSKIKNREKGRK